MWVAAQLGVRCVFSLHAEAEGNPQRHTRREKDVFLSAVFIFCPQNFLFRVRDHWLVGKVENKEFIVKIGKQPSGNASTISESALIYFTNFGEENEALHSVMGRYFFKVEATSFFYSCVLIEVEGIGGQPPIVSNYGRKRKANMSEEERLSKKKRYRDHFSYMQWELAKGVQSRCLVACTPHPTVLLNI